MEVMEALIARTTVYSYLPTPEEPEKLEQVLEAGWRRLRSTTNTAASLWWMIPPSCSCCGKKPEPSP